ncbi:hypothetical protein BFJ63_vAg11181 [Fusarium oxysporum f. sp. narcissi]|uniref:Uncharacterized protein n=1 Tax=Fusarium oxysporum f. sp. narcissi TaxID=451672 RepID=A0A4Q2VEB8_FUSOX|nr:hypothetical protein BFJ63_vAg11181 [Fusarium oxysporum f. sp. narcissi]
MSNEESVRQRLDEFISALSASTKHGRPNARFGHIKIPGFRLEGPSLMESIRHSLSSRNFENIMFVTSELERTVGLGLAEDGTASLAFSEALDCVKMNRADAGHGTAWKSPRERTWQQDGILPRNIVVVFQIDPTVPADCALALIAVVQWALDVSLEAGSQVRVITLATDDGCDFLSTLVALTARDVVVDHLDLGEPWDCASLSPGSVRTTMHSSTDAMETVQTIAAASTTGQLVLSFRDVGLAAEYEQLVPRAQTPFVEFGDEAQQLNLVLQAPTTGYTWLTINPALSLIPLQFHGYGGIHILLGSEHGDSNSWDNVTEQLVQYSRWTSKEERVSQLWWARQLSVSDVHIYHEEEERESVEETLGLFIGSTNRRQRQVENSQLGGFITAVMSIAPWGLRIDQVLACFIRYPSRIRAMRERLKIQRVITSTAINLKGTEEVVFMRVLPLLNYDHRLAFFVALDSDDMVRRVKIQLAAIISIDVHKLAMLNVSEPLDPDGKEAGVILNSCLGYCSDLALSGTLWMVLGLWKGFIVASSKGRDNVPCWSLIVMHKALSRRARGLAERVSQTLHKIGVGSAIHKTFEDETRRFNEEEKRVLQVHLLRAYIFQLVSGYALFTDGELDPQAPLEYLIMANNLEVIVPIVPNRVTSLIRIERFLEDTGHDFTLGISQSIMRLPGTPSCLLDWTTVPKELVAEWLVEHRPGLDLLPALASLTRHHPLNRDEINREN